MMASISYSPFLILTRDEKVGSITLHKFRQIALIIPGITFASFYGKFSEMKKDVRAFFALNHFIYEFLAAALSVTLMPFINVFYHDMWVEKIEFSS